MSASTSAPAAPRSELARALAGELRYSRVWEDHLLLERALGPGTGDELLVVAGAGCNVLALLLAAPRRIVAIDFNPAQTALVQLKLAALRALDREATLELLGIAAGDPLARYEEVRRALPAEARDWWDANGALLAAGVDGAGRLDRFLAGFQREHVARIHPPELLDRLFAARTREARRRAAAALVSLPFEHAFRAYFTREAIAGEGRHPAQFRYAPDGDVAGTFLGRLRRACTELPTRGNFYLERFLRGADARGATLPPWLRRGAYERLRPLVPRVEVVTAELESYLAAADAGSLTGAALSDVFEYMAPAESDRLFARLARALRPRSRIAYWNLLVPRESSSALRGRLRPLGRLARALSRQDRAWFYDSFHVEEVWR